MSSRDDGRFAGGAGLARGARCSAQRRRGSCLRRRARLHRGPDPLGRLQPRLQGRHVPRRVGPPLVLVASSPFEEGQTFQDAAEDRHFGLYRCRTREGTQVCAQSHDSEPHSPR